MQPDFSKNEFASSLNVSRETIDKLEIYLKLLIKWQKAINLVSSKTLPDAWNRHFVDSAQLLPLIPKHVKTIADIGSGAGFPGVVLAILRPDIEVHLIESDEKKCQFMRTVSRETNVKIHVHPKRIEQAHDVARPDMISARALASLEELFGYVLPWAEQNNELTMLFLKGERSADEIEHARTKYSFDVEHFDSETDGNASILRIANLCIK